jgi:raffinose/stachyose/melibiose transport system substrate-binding protein
MRMERRQRRVNRTLRTAGVFFVVGALVVGCSSSTTSSPTASTAASATAASSSSEPSPSAAQDITLTVTASQEWIKPAEQELAKKFEEQTGIHVDYQILPADQYFNVLKTKLNAGEAADIFGGQAGKSDLKVQYDVETNAVDLTDQEWTKRIDPVVLDQSSLNGKVYGAEIWDVVASNYWVVVYNKDIFAKVGASVPKTFAEFEAVAAKIQAAGITPIYEPIADGWHQVLWFPEIGPRLEEAEPGLADKLNANATTFAANANATLAVTQLNELYQKGYFGENTLSETYAETNAKMASGQFAMTVSELSRAQKIEADFPDIKASSFGFFPMPLVDNQLQPVHPAGPAKFVYSKSPHIDQAKQFLAFLMEPENLQYMIDNTPDFETLPFTGLGSKWDAEQLAFLDAYPAKTIVYQDAVLYVNPQWIDIGKDLVSMFSGSMTPADVMTSVDQRRAEQAATAKDPAWAN